MPLNILCTPEFSAEESDEVEALASAMGIDTADFVREAVKFFCGKCVPTHNPEIGN